MQTFLDAISVTKDEMLGSTLQATHNLGNNPELSLHRTLQPRGDLTEVRIGMG
jgi:hypothetical protein